MKTEETSTQGTTTPSTTQSTTTKNTEHKVVLITGGASRFLNTTAHSAEIFVPNYPKVCLLPNLPAPYYGHTQNGGMICGGYKTQNTCREWNSTAGNFPYKPVHGFEPGRSYHVSWAPVSKKETFLIGGRSAQAMNTSTLLKPGIYEGKTGFNPLKYPLIGACSIPDPVTDKVVITGGSQSPMNTSLYNQKGFMKYLGDLNYLRLYHGCTSYISDNKRVCILVNISGPSPNL